MIIKILALSGSSRRGSLNQKLLDIAVHGSRNAGAVVTSVRLADYALPIYESDLEADHGLPEGAKRLQSAIAEHDALLIATPEYNGGYTAMLKNALDWVSRPREDGTSGVTLLAGKVAALVSASPGPLGGLRSQLALRTVLDKLGVLVIPDAFALGMAHVAFDDEVGLKDKGAEKAVANVGLSLCRTAERLANKS
ncbi:NADPH-dependent FMN reductase [Cupriavidus sp. D39]|uniref:NADPH-dependent FMN reductase n=1 Tax=Cupriavidus sp. D39 TaxID=2997877 RepID=UPI00226E55E9|nr:NAD(P)H-dependent oxidoreductase [Cupriavidus sp. D39]MCY0853906.1 NAD(P)H-dependent oxidoreductase [Cupriavidus sp. D39]